MNTQRKIIWIFSAIFAIISMILYFQNSHYWYNYLVFGMLFLFDNLSNIRGNKTTLDLLFNQRYKKFIILFSYLFIAGVLIELIGHFWLNLWYYKFINPVSEHIIANLIGFLTYPIILMSFRETFNFIRSLIKNNFFSLIFTIILSIIIWEIPATFTEDWIYTIPYVNTEFFGVNIIVLLGWPILILFPLLIYKLLDISS